MKVSEGWVPGWPLSPLKRPGASLTFNTATVVYTKVCKNLRLTWKFSVTYSWRTTFLATRIFLYSFLSLFLNFCTIISTVQVKDNLF